MENSITMPVIGTVRHQEGFAVEIEKDYRAGLLGLSEFSHLKVFWVFNRSPWDGSTLVVPPPYRKRTTEIGILATRAPFRPAPIGVSTCRMLSVDLEQGLIQLDWIDAEPESPVVDIKPYHPSEDLVRDYTMPAWCAHWPGSREAAADFDWESEFTFR